MVKEAYAIDKENGDTHWKDAIQLEMNDVRVPFKLLNDDEDVPPAYQYIDCHMVFDVKMESFHRKARFVAGGHMTETPVAATYASVVSRESICIALTIAALNDFDILASNVQNAYVMEPITEKIWTVYGPEFGTNNSRKALIVRALHGPKSSRFKGCLSHLASCM
jgi:hypothetical protein